MFEKKRGTRFLASVMALVMLLSLAPVGALAVDDEAQNQDVVALPADGDNPKPVVTDEENTANTNEEPTPPPSNEGDAGTPADNNDASTAISEMSTDTSTKSNAAAGQTAYFYALLPDVVLPSGTYQPDKFWYGMGTGSIADVSPASECELGAKFNDFFEIGGKITYPSEFPSLKVGSKTYTYDENGMTQGTYSIRWNTVVVADGANAGLNGEFEVVPSEINTYHVNGTIILNETDKYTVMFACQYPNSDKFEVLTEYAYRVATGYQESALTQPNMEPISGYRFDGWYRNEACTDKVDFNGNGTVTKNVTYYGKYVEQKYNISYELNGGTITSSDYTQGEVYPDTEITLPTVTREGYTFDGWFDENNHKYETGNLMPGNNLTLTAKWTAQTATTKTQAMYFVLLPNRGTPKNNADQGEANYLPSSKSNGGAIGRDESNGYAGYLTKAGKEALEAATSKSITNIKDGVPKEYLSAPSDLGFFNPSNWKNGSYKDSLADISMLGENFNVNGIQIVWYTIKNQGDGIHVDGYVKNVAVNVTYHSNFDTDTPYTVTAKTGNTYSALADYPVGNLPTREGYTFAGWYTDANCNDAYTNSVLMSNLHLYAKWTPKQYTYTVEYYYDDAKDASKTENGSAVFGSQVTNYTDKNITGYKFARTEGLPLTISVTETNNVIKVYYTKTENPPAEAQYTVKHYKWDTQEKKYTLANTDVIDSTVGTVVTAKAKAYDGGYILNEQKSAQTMSGTVLKDNTLTLKLYYDIDKIGSGENKDQPDGIPDRYQVTINYVSSNTNWGSVSPLSKEVITLKNGENLVEEATITTTASTATSAGGRCYFVNWTKKQEGTTDVSTVTPSANLTAQTFNAKGGDVYTFTANFDRSSGGGSGGSNRPKPPVVEIPDDVPTGLNGKDHYAYIIGYGNNDVRPQNNITRAEVATIFFRLLTDETREANMTKSNGYNDMKDGAWYTCAVSTLSKMGIIKGYEDGSFKPDASISRAEFAAIAARFDPDGDKTPATFSDVSSHWAKDEISIAANHGWIKGYEDGSFKPDQKITRAETMTLVNRVLKRLPETKDDLHKDMKTWPDNQKESAWFYLAVQEATNSHYQKLKKDGTHETWESMRETRDWAALEK